MSLDNSEIRFTKMHGIGNDYIYINCMESVPEDLPSLSMEMSDRHTGVGGDGIILILPSDKADCMMRIFNADGSEAMMCGNGIRCVGKFVHDKGIVKGLRISVDTRSGVKILDMHPGPDGLIESVTVDMGAPVTEAALVPVNAPSAMMIEEPVTTSAGPLKLTAVSMGNPHGVIFVDTLEGVDVHGLGRELEMHPMWPHRANIEFVEPLPDGSLRMRVWERGSGETMACGTGACAVAVAANLTGRAGSRTTVRLLGGDLTIRLNPDGHVMMTGPAATVFEGTYRRRSASHSSAGPETPPRH